jgi:ATP-dependent helicase/nuclease subunit A
LLASPMVKEAASARYWREVLVSAPVGNALVEGYIDLLVERADGSLVVVDYKTDSIASSAAADRAADHYRLQGAAYALALSEKLGRAVNDVVFVFARSPGEAEERRLPDLPAAIDELRAKLAG